LGKFEGSGVCLGEILIRNDMKRILFFMICSFFGISVNSQIQPEFVKNVKSPGIFTELNGNVFFTCGFTDMGLWTSDGSEAGTLQVKAFNAISYMYKHNNSLYFLADDGVHGVELWKSDGTTLGTQLVKDINPGGSMMGLNDVWLFVSGTNEIYFTADDGIHGRELWKSDGTESGTVIVKDMVPGSGSSEPQLGIYFNNELYFTGYDNVVGRELFKTDGTEAGTVLVKDFYVDPTLGNNGWPMKYTIFDNQLFFYANSTELTTIGHGIFKITTTSPDPQLVKEVFSNSTSFHEFNGELYFGSANSLYNNELWKTDGTELGTILLKEINPSAGSNPNSFYAFNNVLYFSATPDAETGSELFKTDGTTAGTQMVKNINPDNGAGSSINSFFELGGELHFAAIEATYGFEIWKTDGTDAGTIMAFDISPGPSYSYPSGFTNVASKIYFGVGGGTQQGLWKFDLASLGVENKEINNILIFPNPASQLVNLVAAQPTTAIFMSANGAILSTLELNGETTIDVSTYAPGVYFIRTAEGQTVKFIKQ
jgi:ELWxxDGT repeat protein